MGEGHQLEEHGDPRKAPHNHCGTPFLLTALLIGRKPGKKK
jgi:hypothetical protein